MNKIWKGWKDDNYCLGRGSEEMSGYSAEYCEMHLVISRWIGASSGPSSTF
jgi:hypothetical protein